MKFAREFVVNAVVGGVLILLPVYLAVLLLLKGMKSIAGLVHPIAALLPEGLPFENLLALLAVLAICFLVGAVVRTSFGRAIRERAEATLFGNIPGYDMFRGFSRRLAGKSEQNEWQPALAEIEDALVPAFIVEELDDTRFTVFVPSIPTPFAGAVYILDRKRVHIVDVSFAQAVKSISRWGSGSKALVAAMRRVNPTP